MNRFVLFLIDVQNGETALHIAARCGKSIAVVCLLYPQTVDNFNIVRKSVGYFSLARHSYLMGHGAIVKVLSSYTQYRQLNIHLCGDSRAGKTALRKSLHQCIRSMFGSMCLPRECIESTTLDRTIGLEKQCIQSVFGWNQYVLFDYGGEDEYHVNHSPHLASGPDSVYVVVVGLAEVRDDNKIRVRGEEDDNECAMLIERYRYWLRFINSVAAPESTVITVLNFKSVASKAFCELVLEEVTNLHILTQCNNQLRNLKLSNEIIVGDSIMTRAVYASSLFSAMEKAISRQAPSNVTVGVFAVKWIKSKCKDDSWLKVCPVKVFKEQYIWRCLCSLYEVVRASVFVPHMKLLEELLTSETLKGLLANGDILEVNGYVVTDFNWFMGNIMGKLFRDGWRKLERSKSGSIYDFAMTTRDIEKATEMQYKFGGNAYALPELLEQMHICKQFKRPGSEEKYWFPAFHPVSRPAEVDATMRNPVRIVRRRFYLNEDFIFPPGYFAKLYMKMIALDPGNHDFGFWEDSMKFESSYVDGNTIYHIGAYVIVESSSHFDLIVSSTHPADFIAHNVSFHSERQPPCVWHWLNQVRSYVYANQHDCPGLVKEWCLDPLNDYYTELSLQEVLIGLGGIGNTIFHRFYYGACDGKTVVEDPLKMELEVLATMLEHDLIDVGRECILISENQSILILMELESAMKNVQSLKQRLSMANREVASFLHASVYEAASDLSALETGVSDMVQDRRRMEQKLDSIKRFLKDQFNGIHDIPLLPLLADEIMLHEPSFWSKVSTSISGALSTKFRKRLHFVCPVCLRTACNLKAGTRGKGYAVEIDKEWFSKALTYLQTVSVVLRIGVKVAAGLPPDLRLLLEASYARSDTILQEVADIGYQANNCIESVLAANKATVSAEDVSSLESISFENISAQRYPIVIPRMRSSDVVSLKCLVKLLDGSVPPRFTGLEHVLCDKEGSVAWVCGKRLPGGGTCQDAFKKVGTKCLKVIYEDEINTTE